MARSMDPEVVDLVERHLDLVARIVTAVATRTPKHVDRDDLRRAGALGLVEAAARFDPAVGVAFDRYAAARIRGAVIDALRSTDWAPRSVRAAARRLDMVETALVARLGRLPSVEELSREADVEVDRIQRIRVMVATAGVASIDHVLDGTDDSTLAGILADRDQIDPAERLARAELVETLRAAVRSLPVRQRRVIEGYFLEGRRSDELADELHVTESRVCQLRRLGLAELRRAIEGRDRPIGPILRDLEGAADHRPHYRETA